MSDQTGFRLDRVDDRTPAVDALAARCGGRVPFDAVLDDLPRRLRTTRAPGRAVHEAFRFDGHDQLDLRWWPQGVTTAADAGDREGRRLALVSWYAKQLPWDAVNHGVRISVMDLDRRRYRHVLLVQATDDGGVEPLHCHAGGIVWHGSHLHVAATGKGLYTCRLDDLVRVPDRATASGYRYVLPVRWQLRARTPDGAERLRYSFLSLDRSVEPPALLAGEYTNDPGRTRRLVRLGAGDGGADRADVEVLGDGVARMQGVAAARGRLHVTVSHGRLVRGSVFTGTPGDLREHRHATPMGNEDVAYHPGEDLLYSVSEHPTVRWLFTMRRSWFD